LIWGGGPRRGEMVEADASAEAVAFMGELCRRVGEHGTCFCFEPLGPEDSDFINSALDSLRIVEMVDHPALRVQLDAKALVENDEAEIGLFQAVAARLVHFHANEPGLGVLGESGAVDHAAMGRMLRDIDYAGFVSIEQRILNQADPLSGVRRSAEVAIACYGDVRGPADGPRA
ncbi:MAG: TIM barrel protein, partial [Candidatus Hydrogenedentes bacterium]|nr:TIM barrel protein [Candidatus Hydrogenedentota bacterium]